MPELRDLRWMEQSGEEDLAFIKRFILLSGSLKDLAEAYKVSYPTLRLRLDRLIEKIKILDSQGIRGPLRAVAAGPVCRRQTRRRHLQIPFRGLSTTEERNGMKQILSWDCG